jgi:hypothetical protein
LDIFPRTVQNQPVSSKFIPYQFFTMQLAIRKSAITPKAFHGAPQAFPVEAI